MKYMGSKSRIAKYIVPIIQQRINDYGLKCYVEPFVGGANVIDKIACENKIGCDKQKYLIALYENLHRIQELPEFVTKEHYSLVRDSFKNNTNDFEDWYKGAIGFFASYNGKFFEGGYAAIAHTKNGGIRNYYAEARRNLEKQIKDLGGIVWRFGDYRETCFGLKNCLIYCDPPYKETTQYGASANFNHSDFWDWCREMSKENVVLVSEQQAEEDFECIWEMPTKRTIDNTKRIDCIERLFELKQK
ncbi:MAG: DNA adenine methylase [Solibacillus sp.]